MKLATALIENKETIGLIKDDLFIHLEKATSQAMPATILAAIQEGESFIEKVSDVQRSDVSEAAIPLAEVKLLAPIPRPKKNIFCVGKNYAAHAIELGSEADIPSDPIFFSKTPTTVSGPNEEIPLHKDVTNALDYEGELVVIISKRGFAIQREEAFDYVFGYTIMNDITARDLQQRHQQYLLGKSLDGSCPMGPYIIHKSAIRDPHALNIETKVNGEVRQQASTKQFIFNIPELIATLSQGMTLEAGDMIATGTPEGVGMGYTPPKLLRAGDTIEITIEDIGTLLNRVSP